MTESTPLSFMVAMKNYFGLKPDQRPMEFVAEIRELTHEQKVEFHEMLVKAGVQLTPPQPPK